MRVKIFQVGKEVGNFSTTQFIEDHSHVEGIAISTAV
jgi:hypothetical protein